MTFSFLLDYHAEFRPVKFASSLKDIQVRKIPPLPRILWKKKVSAVKKEFKAPKSRTNVICLPRQGKFRRYELPSRPCCLSCQVRLKRRWSGNISYLLFCWCLQQACPVANKLGSLFKTSSCVNKQSFFEGKVDLKYKVKICGKDITLREWHLISLKIARVFQRTLWTG